MKPENALELTLEERNSLKKLLVNFEEFLQIVARTNDGLARFFGTSNPVPYGGVADSEQLQRLRLNNPRAFSAWTHEEETLLLALVEIGYTPTLISFLTGRSLNSIKIKISNMNELDNQKLNSNTVIDQPTSSQSERGVDRGPQSLNKHGMVNPPPTGRIARDTI